MKVYNNDIMYLKKARELLIDIDMVNGFLKEGALAAPSIMRIVPRQKELIEEALESEDTGVVFVKDSHSFRATEFKRYLEHCMAYSKEAELIDELKDYEKHARVYYKNSTNLIFAPGIMHDLLILNDLEEVKLMGCLSEVCVQNGAIGLRTFFDQHNRNVDVCVYSDAIDTFDAPDHEAEKVTEQALEDMTRNGIKVLRKRKN